MSDLKRVVALAKLMTEQQGLVEQLEQQLKEAKEEFARTEREDLPLLMNELGLTELKLEDGWVVRIAEDVTCGIPEAKRADAHAWLNEHGFGGLIKTQVAIAFERGEHDKAVAAAKALGKKYPTTALNESVHPATLKSFVKEQLAEGAALPLELFSVHPFNKATLKKK
jgi:hypothetical protein